MSPFRASAAEPSPLTAAGGFRLSPPAADLGNRTDLRGQNADRDQDRKSDGQDEQSFVLEQVGHFTLPVGLLSGVVPPARGRSSATRVW